MGGSYSGGMGGAVEGGGYGGGEHRGGMRGPGMMAGTGGPPVMFHIEIVNHGAATATVSVEDFHSALGNFVVFPEKLVVEPAKSAEFEPMTSRVAAEFSELNVSLTLREGERTEQKVVAMHLMTPPPASPASPAEAQ
jgi:hypothetical protein